MQIPHAIVWLDHKDAVVCFLHGDEQPFTQQHIAAHAPHGHPHRDGHARDEHLGRFFQDIAQALAGVAEVLVVGPAQAKHDFQEFAATRLPDLHRRIRGVESADHPSSAQLVARARAFFKQVDAMDGRFHIDLH